MELFEISWKTILKVSASGLFLYLVAPLFLIIRDLLITKFIEKFILTEAFRFSIHQCESARWLLGNKYNELLILENGLFYIGERQVTEEEFSRYDKEMWRQNNRFELLNTKIKFRSNIINYSMNHYKNSSFVNPIENLRVSAYKHTEKLHSHS